MNHPEQRRQLPPGPGPRPLPGASEVHGPTGPTAVDLFGLLRRNVWLLVLGAVITSGTIGFAVWMQPPSYRAEALVRLIDVRGAMTGTSAAMTEGVMGLKADAILSEIQVMRGRQVVGTVVDREGLRLVSSSPSFPIGLLRDVAVEDRVYSDTLQLTFTRQGVQAASPQKTVAAPYGTPIDLDGIRFTVPSPLDLETATVVVLPREAAIDRVLERLETHPVDRTDAVSVSYTASDPWLAQRVTNTIIAVFQEANAGAAQEQSRRRRIFLEEQLRTTDSLLTAAEDRLGAFRTGQQLFSSRERFVTQQQSLLEMNMEREQLAAERRMYGSLLAQLGSGGGAATLRTLISSPGVATNAVVTSLYAQLAEQEAQRQALTTGPQARTAAHPEVIRLDGMISSLENRLLDAVRSHVAFLDARIAAFDGLRQGTTQDMASLPQTEIEEGRLVQEAQAVRLISDQLKADLQRARMAEAVEAGQVQVVHAAPLPLEPNDSGLFWKLALGMVLGMLLGTGGAVLREALNTSIKQPGELENSLGLPRLAVVPQIARTQQSRSWLAGRRRPVQLARAANGAKPTNLAMLQGPAANGAEAYRMLRTNLLYAQANEGLSTLLVTSAAPGEGKTTTTSNLAIAFAQQGQRVLLVDADLRRPRLHKTFDVPAGPGLVELLRGSAKISEALQETVVDGLTVLTCGELPSQPAELLGGRRMKELVRILAESFDLVIFDTPPVLAAAETTALATLVNGVLMVVRAGQTERAEARLAVDQLNDVGARILGAVLNDPDAATPRYGGYNYYKYYSTVGE